MYYCKAVIVRIGRNSQKASQAYLPGEFLDLKKIDWLKVCVIKLRQNGFYLGGEKEVRQGREASWRISGFWRQDKVTFLLFNRVPRLLYLGFRKRISVSWRKWRFVQIHSEELCNNFVDYELLFFFFSFMRRLAF